MELSLLFGIQIWQVIKILTIILLGMYIIFSLVVVRQTKLMTDTLELGLEGTIKLLAYTHFIFAVLVLLTAVIIL